MVSNRRVVIKLSGEALGGDSDNTIDKATLELTVRAIKNVLKSGVSILIVVGAGNICRGEALTKNDVTIDRECADYMGMLGTVINAIALENALNKEGVPSKAFSSLGALSFVDEYSPTKAIEYLDKGYIVIAGGGLGKPFYSTDTASVQRAIDIHAQAILMAKNGVDGIYDDDPRLNKNAKLYKEITPQELVDKKLKVMDLSAAKLLNEHDIIVYVFNNNNLDNFTLVSEGKNIGTIIRR